MYTNNENKAVIASRRSRATTTPLQAPIELGFGSDAPPCNAHPPSAPAGPARASEDRVEGVLSAGLDVIRVCIEPDGTLRLDLVTEQGNSTAGRALDAAAVL